jgi:nitrite reductase/ring-hydroxylating ferredoxin subunit
MTRLTHVGTYRRDVHASIERVWENALDWEHLPWLHSSSFAAITLLERSPAHWRAAMTVAGVMPHRLVVELRTDRPRLAYATRTLEGFGAATEVRTQLERVDDRTTRIAVGFHVAGAARLFARLAGARYTKLYTRLWDEDERMMQQRQAMLDEDDARKGRKTERTPADGAAGRATALGHVDALRARLPLVVKTERGAVRIVDVESTLVAYRTRCPHLGGPLDAAAVVDGVVTCPWHGYRFDVRSGAPVGGHACRLLAAPRVDVDPTTGATALVWT